MWTRFFFQQSSKLSEKLNPPANQKEIEKGEENKEQILALTDLLISTIRNCDSVP